MPQASAIPGLKRLPKSGGCFTWAASQISRTAKDFRPRTVRLWHGPGAPSGQALEGIARHADNLSLDLAEWLKGRGRAGGQVARLRRGQVYFLRDGARVKIGFAMDVARRIRDIGAHLADQPELLVAINGSMGLERALHAKFADLALRNEWFRLEGPLADFIAKLRVRQAQRAILAEQTQNGSDICQNRSAPETISSQNRSEWSQGLR